MGTFIQSFSVDGEVYELYANTDGEPAYQLLDYSGRSLTAATLVDVPDKATVTALVIAWCDGGCASCLSATIGTYVRQPLGVEDG